MAQPIVETQVKWPGGARCAVMLSFDFDAETLWIGRDKANWKRPGTLSQGKYGANLGVPKILETLEDAGIPATFFVPGWTAENHTGRVEMILERGHEIGHHSYLHEWIDPEDPAAEEAELDKGLVEKITDPLTHLIRNSCDHGIEMPEDRRARPPPDLARARAPQRFGPRAAGTRRRLRDRSSNCSARRYPWRYFHRRKHLGGYASRQAP